MNIFRLSLAILTALLIAACGNNQQRGSLRLDEEKNSVTIIGENIEYIFPSDIANWAVAPTESMPDGMQFFGVDRYNNICVGLFKPEKPVKSPHMSRDYSETEFTDLLRLIAYSDAPNISFTENITYSDTIFKNSEAICFRIRKTAVDKSNANDSTVIIYDGYIFDKVNEPYGIVVISGEQPQSETFDNDISKFFEGLTINR